MTQNPRSCKTIIKDIQRVMQWFTGSWKRYSELKSGKWDEARTKTAILVDDISKESGVLSPECNNRHGRTGHV
jgi:hypothetical protein